MGSCGNFDDVGVEGINGSVATENITNFVLTLLVAPQRSLKAQTLFLRAEKQV